MTLTVVVPTQGRDTLSRCLASMRPRYHYGYRPEVLVVADTHGPLLMDVAGLCRDEGVSYLEYDAGYHDWGYPQLQYGYDRATQPYVMNLGDDDAYRPGAVAAICDAIAEVGSGPLLFRAILHPSPTRGNTIPVTLWTEVGRLERKHVTGQNFACPNDPTRMGAWGDDFEQMEQTIRAWHGQVAWRSEVIAECF